MVLTSAQIAEMNGSFQGQSMNQMMYSGMVGQSAFSPQRMAGATANTIGAIGGPAAMLGAGMLGLDPISMALKGGSFGMSVGGLGGMAGGALAGAGVAGLGAMAAGWAGNQFMTGAQQHQQLGANLRSNFSFRNQFGGNGFTGGEVGQIGSSMRQMSGQIGPAGEMVGFEELGRLAANMGRMGMAQGVRNAKDFTDKFKQMVSTLKEVATQMGTSLEEAQKMMAEMKTSGVFGMGAQKAFAGMIRSGAQAGGMATSELTGMMAIGSQVSRSIGGRGIAGAQAGVRTITNIGVAQQMGILSEEDIYNATGETGAMGRRALATQQLQGAAQFLRGGLGRRMIAAMAGKNGSLDESSVEEFASGVTTDRTRQMWEKNLSGVGRANFIRNEGRLRGEVLRRFGGLAPAVAMRGWLEGKGVDVDSDNDRAMLFLQRQLNMGRDDADVMMKQIRSLPQIEREQKISDSEERQAQQLRLRQSHTGIEGIKRKLDESIQSVQNTFQQAGAGFMGNLENQFERFVNYLTDTRVTEFRRDVTRALSTGMGGGVAGRTAMANTFGVGGLGSAFKGVTGMSKGGMGFGYEFKNRGDREQFAAAGYDVARYQPTSADKDPLATGQKMVEGASGADIIARLRGVNAFASAAMGPSSGLGLPGFGGFTGPLSAGQIASAAESKAKLRDLYINKVTGSGYPRVASIQKALAESDDPAMRSIAKELASTTDPAKKGQLIASITNSIGIADESRMFAVPDMMGSYNTSEYLTAKDQASAIGKAIVPTHTWGELHPALLSRLIGPNDRDRRMETFISDQAREAAGAYAKTDAGRALAAQAVMGTGDQAAFQQDVQNQLLELNRKRDKKELDATGEGTQAYLQSVRATYLYREAGGVNATKEGLQAAAKRAGMSVDDLVSRAKGIARVTAGAQADARMQVSGEEARGTIANMRKGGLITEDGVLSQDLAGKFGEKTDEGRFLRAAVAQQTSLAQITSLSSPEEREALIGKVLQSGEAAEKGMEGMSVAGLRKLAEGLRGRGAADMRTGLLSRASTMERLERGGTGVRNLSKLMGVEVDKDLEKDIAALQTKPRRGQIEDPAVKARMEQELANKLAEKAGVDPGNKDVLAAVHAARTGDSHGAATALSHLGGALSEAQQKRSLAAAEAQDPLGKKTNEHLEKIEAALGNQGRLATALGMIAINTSKDPKNAEKQLKDTV